MTVEIIEYLLIGVVILLQLINFGKTLSQISTYKQIIPDVKDLAISKILIPLTHLAERQPRVILKNLANYLNSAPTAEDELVDEEDHLEEAYESVADYSAFQSTPQPSAEVTLINATGSPHPIFSKILESVNSYLIRNRGASSDFNLIKDIVERNTDAIEEDINLTISIPLYLGLAGTMIGIVIGLFNMPSLDMSLTGDETNNLLNEGISVLINGVKIAMIASLTGLLLTVINSGWNFKGSRSLVEARKNELYTFMQIELLPVINQGLAGTFESLQRNLMKFNDEFKISLAGMSGIFDANTQTIQEQKELLELVNQMDISRIAKYNIDVLRQLNDSVKEFEKFNSYIRNVNAFVTNSQQIVDRTNELLERTDNFKSIAENLNGKLNQSEALMKFLEEHFRDLEKHKAFTTNAVADVGYAISASFKDLQQHILNSSEAIKQFTVDETESLRKALSESKTNLGNLQHLSTLSKDVSLMKDSSASQLERVKSEVQIGNDELRVINKSLKQLEGKLEGRSVLGSVKNFWKKITTKK